MELSANSGWPDYLFLGELGILFFIEFKAEGKKPRKLQQHRINRLLNMGHPVYIVDNIKEGKRVIDVYTT